jgi:hypothetical protein
MMKRRNSISGQRGEPFDHLDRARFLRDAISKAVKAAHQAYQFNPGSYTREVLSEVCGLEIALQPVLELLEAER